MYRELNAPTTSGYVGIWWYTDDKEVIGLWCSLDEGENPSGSMIEYPLAFNHQNSFRRVVQDARPDDAEDILKLGFKGIERGRVYYEIVTHCYHVICSDEMKTDSEFKQKIREFYHLDGGMVQFDSIPTHYSKLPLTGNPAIDSYNYDL
ncbi:MAG: hypothetical protein NC548_49680 [Lachnospiraceae bacterium]|nr:hypothetical protein [Lachnospiraceae bacterium]